MSEVTIEFYGIPRMRAGCAEITVSARTVAAALDAIQARCPGWHDLMMDGKLAPHFRLSLDGKTFVSDLSQEVPEGTRLLLLSADVGG